MKHNTILITGGTGKLGKLFTTHFIKNGWKVVITSSNFERSEIFRKSIPDGDNLEIIISDLSKPEASELLIKTIIDKGIKINHLVNNARSLKSLKVNNDGFSEREDFLMEYIMHVVAPYEISKYLYLSQKKSLKTITNIGSQYGTVAHNPSLYKNDLTKAPIQYSLAKASLHHLTKELAVRYANDNIRVNCIAFGGIEGRADDQFKSRYSKLVPNGRMLSENEIIGPLEFLLSESSSSITGEVIAADGGWTIW